MKNFTRLLATLVVLCLHGRITAQSHPQGSLTRIDSAVLQNEDNYGARFAAFDTYTQTGLLALRITAHLDNLPVKVDLLGSSPNSMPFLLSSLLKKIY